MSHLPENYLTRLPSIPTKEQEERSLKLKCDSFYAIPKEVECFLQRANKELPKGWCAKPWTINRAVTLFHLGTPVRVIDYDAIEDDIVKMLDYVVSLSRNLII